ncbi:CC_3452 family protein [Brevundimonas sp. Root1279]|uniref:CC_3452 family protein n=1 Tax=Brevundimonas sp. Root1279 TaxID=1736443 RepID=UPI0006F69F3A|nr:hypothetical protein [Brevundimonas sp. Root1279]KQW82551.1 hypothetical protein ASC65_10040 [Brevundimonas sp. Root1279]
MLLMTLMAAALAVAQPAQPVQSGGASATLTQPREVRQSLDGRSWNCNGGGECVGRGGGTTQPLMRECRRFVTRFGPVSAYSREGLALTEAEIGQCNSDSLVRAGRQPSL